MSDLPPAPPDLPESMPELPAVPRDEPVYPAAGSQAAGAAG